LRDDVMPGARADVVALIDHDQIGGRWLHPFRAHDASMIGLHAGDLDGMVRSARQFGGDDAVRNLEGIGVTLSVPAQ
jgi:hypothetical protein